MELSHVGGSILLLGAWLPDCRTAAVGGRLNRVGVLGINLGVMGSEFQRRGWWLGEGLIINLNHSFRGWGLGKMCGVWGCFKELWGLTDRWIQDLGVGQCPDHQVLCACTCL